MDKEVVVHIHNGVTKRNTTASVLRWMNLESIIQSEVSKRKIKIILQCIYMESRKMVLNNLFTGQQRKNRHTA